MEANLRLEDIVKETVEFGGGSKVTIFILGWAG